MLTLQNLNERRNKAPIISFFKTARGTVTCEGLPFNSAGPKGPAQRRIFMVEAPARAGPNTQTAISVKQESEHPNREYVKLSLSNQTLFIFVYKIYS